MRELEVHKDARGSFVEAFKFPNDGQVSYLIVPPNEVRGNHYHERKTEHFVVVYGSATITMKDRVTGNILKVETGGNKPLCVTVTPNNTHNIVASEEGAIVLIWCDEQYDDKDPDTIGEEI